MANRLTRNAVFAQLVDERARQDIVKEGIDFCNQCGLRARPRDAPENREDFNRGEEWSAAICEVRRRSRPGGESLWGWPFCVASDVQRYDADCIGIMLAFQLSCGGGLSLCRAPLR